MIVFHKNVFSLHLSQRLNHSQCARHEHGFVEQWNSHIQSIYFLFPLLLLKVLMPKQKDGKHKKKPMT